MKKVVQRKMLLIRVTIAFIVAVSEHWSMGCRKRESGKDAGFGKPPEVATAGQEVTSSEEAKVTGKSLICVVCKMPESSDKPIMQCSGCKSVGYCSKRCQQAHWPGHKTVCGAIQSLEARERIQSDGTTDSNMFVSHLTPKQHSIVAKLVGEKCKIHCVIGGMETEALWDTGAQVSILPEGWLKKNCQNCRVRNIEELLGTDVKLNLTAANGTLIPYEGWVSIGFKLATAQHATQQLDVPFLVAKEGVECPIVGYNVIELIVKESASEAANDPIIEIMQGTFLESRGDSVNALISMIQASDTEDELCVIRTPKKNTVVPAGQTVKVACRANTGPIHERTPVLFEPDTSGQWPDGLDVSEGLMYVKQGNCSQVKVTVHNHSKHGISLHGRTTLGYLQAVKSVTAVDVKQSEMGTEEPQEPISKEPEEKLSTTHAQEPLTGETYCPEVDLSNLEPEQRQLAQEMLRDECESFSRKEQDIGCVPELELDITLNDNQPVQKRYVSIPRFLYAEVKQYIEDLLNQKFIAKSKSPYSSPVVCVRKKDGTLRLCVDYRELNKKTVADRHPIPKGAGDTG